MYLPDPPAHVVQRGNNRNACFIGERELRRYHVRLHAYVLMTNHVYLLLTPRDETSISRLMQHLGRQYVLYVNQTLPT